ncbi:MAG: 2-oxoglutarate and iron-dependent oxygenase domain-containing protein [Pseudomonadota bacterium]
MSEFFEPIPFSLWREDKQAFADRLGQSFRETGFAVITEHPLKQSIIDTAVARTKDFFALPDDTKRTYYSEALGGQRGYTPFGTENAKGRKQADLKEFWHTGRVEHPGGDPLPDSMLPTPSVSEIEGFDAATRKLYEELDLFGQDLLRGVAIHLGLDEEWFTGRVDDGNSILRLLHYPAQSEAPPPGSVRAGAHEDINVITLLLGAEEAGLEVKHRSGEWLAVNPPAGALVINVGDMLQRLTNGVLPSTTHRVVNPSSARSGHARYSTPFFLHFESGVLIDPLESCIGDEAPMPAITADDYLMERLREIGLVKA